MFCKLVLLSLVSVSLAKPQHLPAAAQYPAGVNPQDCPGFPICDNARLHNPQSHWGAPAPAWQPQQQWGAPAPAWQPEQHWGAPAPSWQPAPAPSAGGDKFPAGVNPHTCPNYPFCDVNAGHHGAVAAPPLPGWTERQYPAGVSPHQCPNFPYCN
ncbi:PREDICTED: cuticle protein 1-like [Rhagoletis zephyria]|uniref:cuticle protein 1-like n=1 Tax=Rhagoletis zephyria TaxID=28612 RepID=UPI0008117AA0|nr:PREDICTED: cuticle protein 1-like [Rhagoletis zephyria]XP_017488208.1 PREDICTED: cuticle protein 1-like [Rhagoletis zephyria]